MAEEMFDINQLNTMKVGLAAPVTIRSWSGKDGVVTKPETINYRSQKPEPDGLFCERIFGPSKDYECHCGHYKKIKDKGKTCEKCGVEVISKEWRRERFGRIELVSPCVHIWYLKDIPCRIGLALDMAPKDVEEIVYFASHVTLAEGLLDNAVYKGVVSDRPSSSREDGRIIFQRCVQEVLDAHICIDPGTSKVLKDVEAVSNEGESFNRQVKQINLSKKIKSFPLFNRNSRKVFIAVMNEIIESGSINSDKAQRYIDKLNDSKNVVTFEELAEFVHAETGATFGPLLEEGSLSEQKANSYIERFGNNKESFDYYGGARFLEKFAGAQFSEGAEAIKTLLQQLDGYKDNREVDEKYQGFEKVCEIGLTDVEAKAIEKLWEDSHWPEQDITGDKKDSVVKHKLVRPIKYEIYRLYEDLKTSTGQKRRKIIRRLKILNAFVESDQLSQWMILDAVPVIPPDLRPMLQLDGGRFAASDLNDLYRRIIARNTRLKKLIDWKAPPVMLVNEKRMLQEAVDALIDNGRRSKPVTGANGRALKSLSSGLKGKQGRFRQNLLGKRVDYSGRSVIAVGPQLKMYECGLPSEMAIQLLRPFIAAILLQKNIAKSHKQADSMIDKYDPKVYAIVEKIIGDHPVFLNRAPTLHRLGIQAFQPKLVEGHAIRLHPLVCTGFNADFDGDQMAVHVPLGKHAQFEALNLMLASNNILGPKDGKPIVIPSQDMIVGNYWLTMEESKQDYLERAQILKDELKIDAENIGEIDANNDQREQYLAFSSREASVFSSVGEVRKAYEAGTIGLHNRIAIPASKIHKNFAPANDANNVKDYALPYSFTYTRKEFENGLAAKAFVSEDKFPELYGETYNPVETYLNGQDEMTYVVEDMYLLTTVGKIIFNDIFPDDFRFINDKPDAPLSDVKTWFVPKGSYIPFEVATRNLHEPIKKKTLGTLIDLVFHKYDMISEEELQAERDPNASSYEVRPCKTAAILDKLKDQGFEYSTISGVTVAMSDINLKPGENEPDIDDFKKEKVEAGYVKVDQVMEAYRHGLFSDEERHKAIVNVWNGVTKEVETQVAKYLKEDVRNPLVIMSESGARGNLANFKQLVGMKGLVANPKNEEIELPVVSSYQQGLKVAEFFINTHGARKGGADTALKTADSGYLTRRLVDVSQDVVVTEEDCGCDHGFMVREIRNTKQDQVVVKLEDRLKGRFAMRDIVYPNAVANEDGTYNKEDIIVAANTMISDEQALQVVAAGITEVEIRSLFTCETKNGVCRHCYGRNMATGRMVELGEAVGIMAAQSIGEPGTQLTMRVFHTGGMAGSDITQGLPRVQELVEARNPKGEALVSEIDGTVTNITKDTQGRDVVTVTSTSAETVESPMPEIKEYTCDYGAELRVKKGSHVEAGGKITEGAVDPKKLLEVADIEKVEVYMIKEIQKVYAAQGIGISDKHLEVVIRQMLRKLVIIDGGDTRFLPGQRIDKDRFTSINQLALLKGKRPAAARPLLLGITKAALETESFLSAASFQQTTKVLTNAAIAGKRDNLHGLKENVITGKLIPAGTGLETPDQEEFQAKNFTVAGKMEEVRDTYYEEHDHPELEQLVEEVAETFEEFED